MSGNIDAAAIRRAKACRLVATADIVVVPDRKWFVLAGGFRFDGSPIDFSPRPASCEPVRAHVSGRNADERERTVTVFVDAEEEAIPLRGVVSGWTVFEIDGTLRRCQLVVFEATSAREIAQLGEHRLVDVPVAKTAAWCGPSDEPKFGYDS